MSYMYFWKMSQRNTCTTFDLKVNLGQSNRYFTVHWFLFFYFWLWKHFSFIGKARFRRATLSCDSSYFFEFSIYIGNDINWNLRGTIRIIIFTEGLTSFFWQTCALFWSLDYGELVSSHGSTTPENNDIILWRMRRAYEFEPQARLRQRTSRASHLALSPDKTTIGKYLFGHAGY